MYRNSVHRTIITDVLGVFFLYTSQETPRTHRDTRKATSVTGQKIDTFTSVITVVVDLKDLSEEELEISAMQDHWTYKVLVT